MLHLRPVRGTGADPKSLWRNGRLQASPEVLDLFARVPVRRQAARDGERIVAVRVPPQEARRLGIERNGR